jgi:hypothetical protein
MRCTQAFEFSDNVLNSALGRRDGGSGVAPRMNATGATDVML